MLAPALAEDITRTCFPGVCVESVEAFTAFNRQPENGMYRLKVSRSQSEMYLHITPTPRFPHCDALCRVEVVDGEKRTINKYTERVSGRLIGPFEPCRGAEPFFVHIYSYQPEAGPDIFTVEREC